MFIVTISSLPGSKTSESPYDHEDSPSMATPERQNYKKGGIVSLELCVNPIFKLFQTACIDIEQCKTKTEPQRCFQKKHLDIASRMNHCASWRAVDGKCDVKRFTHHCIAQRTLAFHCFGSVLLWVFRKLIFKLCNGVFSHLISKTDWIWFIFKLA